jgi:hypothetical protein
MVYNYVSLKIVGIHASLKKVELAVFKITMVISHLAPAISLTRNFLV